MSVSFELIKLGFKERMQYRFDYLMNFLLVPFTFLVIYFVWNALYTHNAVSVIEGFSFNETLTYFAMAVIVQWATGSWIGDMVGRIIAQGDFARYIIFPIDFYKYHLLRQIGSKITSNIIRAPVFFLIFVYFFKIFVNTNPLQWFLFLISCTLSFLLLNTFRYMIALLTFWEEAYWTLGMFSWAIIEFFSGALLPLEFYPSFIQPILNILPFKNMVYTPVMIYMNRISIGDTLWSFVNQIVFIVVFYLISKWLFELGRIKFTSQGG